MQFMSRRSDSRYFSIELSFAQSKPMWRNGVRMTMCVIAAQSTAGSLLRIPLQDKVELFLDRMHLLLQRLKRNRNFSRPAFAGIKSNSREYAEVSLSGWLCGSHGPLWSVKLPPLAVKASPAQDC
jgi:hypothetical protein